MPFNHPLSFEYASAPGTPHSTVEAVKAKFVAVDNTIKVASYIIDLSHPFDKKRYEDEIQTCKYVYPNAVILLVGIQARDKQTNIADFQSLSFPSFITSSNQPHNAIAVPAIAILFEQLKTAIQSYGNTDLGLALQDLVKRAQQESPRAALILASETLNLLHGLQQFDQEIRLKAIENFYETTKDNINYSHSHIYHATRRSILSICLIVLCSALIGGLIGAVCSGVCGGLGFLIAGPVGGTVGVLIGVALSIWLAQLATEKFNSTPHFVGQFCLFKTSIGKSVDHVVSTAANSPKSEAHISDVSEDVGNLMAAVT